MFPDRMGSHAVRSPPTQVGRNLTTYQTGPALGGFPKSLYKRIEMRPPPRPGFSLAAVQLTPALSSCLPNLIRPGAVVIHSFLTTFHNHHVLQSRPHLPRNWRTLHKRLGRPSRSCPQTRVRM